MATQYPNGIDNTSSLPYVTNGVSPMVGDDVNRLRDAIVAVETELGANPSGTFTSVDARLGAAETAISDYANSTFLVLSTDGFISQERVFAPSVNFAVVDGGAGANYEIDLAANVGIGTITPASDYSLTLDGDGSTRIGGVTLRNAGTDTFYIGSATASDSANISLMNPNTGYVALGTDGTERVRITSAGDIGLGTTSPAGRLHISGGDLLVDAGDVGIGTLSPAGLLHVSGGDLLVDTGDVGIGTVAPAGRLHVSGGDLLVDTGDVGIGTITPSELLHVSGGNLLLESTAGAGVPYATLKGTQGGIQLASSNDIGKLDVLDSAGVATISLLNNGDNRLVGVDNVDFSFYTNNTERMRITASGELLVNTTTNPDSARLHVSGGGITHSSNQFNARPGSGVNYEWINRDGAGHTWYVNSAATQVMTITSAGNVGIGTASPAAQLSIGSSSEFQVDSSGDIARIKDVPYLFPVTQGIAGSVLGNDGSGGLDWSLVQDTEIVGGLQTVANTTARDAIATAQRKEGMVVYSQADDRYFVLEGGLTNSDWKEFHDDSRLIGGLRVVANATERNAIPAARLKIGMLVLNRATLNLDILTSLAPTWATVATIGSGSVSSSSLVATTDLQTPRINMSGEIIESYEAAWLGGLAGRTQSAPVRRSQVMSGCELLPDVAFVSGSDYTFVFRVKPGVVAFAGGGVVSFDADITVNGNTAASWIGGVIPGSFPRSVYAFLRIDDPEDVPDGLRLSASPPDALGRPATADVGYSVDKYCYVGLLHPLSLVFDATATYEWTGIWGMSAVTHLGDGTREVLFDGALNTFSNNLVRTSGTSDVVAIIAGDPSINYPTARALIVEAQVSVNAGSATGSIPYVELAMPGLAFKTILKAGDNGWGGATGRVPNRTGTPFAQIQTSGGYAGTILIQYTGRLLGIVENIKAPVAVNQSEILPKP